MEMERRLYSPSTEHTNDSHIVPKVEPQEIESLHYPPNSEQHVIPKLEPVEIEPRHYLSSDENLIDNRIPSKMESGEMWDPSVLPVNGTSCYTPLQPCLPESSVFQQLDVCSSAAQTFSGLGVELDINNYYYYNPNGYYNVAEQASPQDEGIGSSSPSSFHSNSPQTTATEHNPSFGNLLHMPELQSERTSPSDSGCAEEIPDVRIVPNTQCVKCGVATGVHWQRNHMGHFLCHSCYLGENAPGLLSRIESQQDQKKRKKQTQASAKKMNHSCSHCKTTVTSLWRRNSDSEVVCNSCGLYQKLKGVPRPLSMRKDVIQRRKRKPRSVQPKEKPLPNAPAGRPTITSVSAQSLSPTYSGFSTYHPSDMVPQLPPQIAGYGLPPLSINPAIHNGCVNDMARIHVMQPRVIMPEGTHRYLPANGDT